MVVEVANEPNYIGDVVHFEEDNRYSREEMTVSVGNVVEIGSPMFLDTGTGEYRLWAAGDATAAVSISKADATIEAQQGVAVVRHATLKENGIQWGALAAGDQDAAKVALADAGIIVRVDL